MKNRIDETLTELSEAFERVELSRDFFDRINTKTMKYLPKWKCEEDCQYDNRVKGTAFDDIYHSIISKFVEATLYEPPNLEGLEDYNLDNVDCRGTKFFKFSASVLEASLIAGVEFVSVETNELKKRTFFKRYKYEQLVSFEVYNGEVVKLVFRETLRKKDENFRIYEEERIIVYGIGYGEIWEYKKNGLEMTHDWRNNLDRLPVVWVETGDRKRDFEYLPKFYTVADLCKVILRLQSRLTHVLEIVGDPIPIFYNEDITSKKSSFLANITRGLGFGDKKTDGFEYAEATGSGVELMRNQIKDLQESIDKLTYYILRRGESKTIIDSEENQKMAGVFMSSVASELEDKFSILFEIKAKLDNRNLDLNSEKIKFNFKTKFNDILANEFNLKLMYDSALNGLVRTQDYLRLLRSSGSIPKDVKIEDIEEDLESEGINEGV